jgi:hypothetical protein
MMVRIRGKYPKTAQQFRLVSPDILPLIYSSSKLAIQIINSRIWKQWELPSTNGN